MKNSLDRLRNIYYNSFKTIFIKGYERESKDYYILTDVPGLIQRVEVIGWKPPLCRNLEDHPGADY